MLNPDRDIGPTNIHGIAACDVLDAPNFVDVADYLLSMLRGRVVVAHNATFDVRFLHRELGLAHYEIADRPRALCSMKWARRVIGAAKLVHCCEAFGIPLENAHSALGDARATAALLPHLITGCCAAEEWGDDLLNSSRFAWPAPIGRLHNDYLRAVAVEALADGVVTDDERRDLEGIAGALGLGIPYVDEALGWASANTASAKDQTGGFSLRPGDRVVFTGPTRRSRDQWIATIRAAGLVFGGITKATRLLVAADPDSLSGKAAKARQYAIPVVDETTFESMLSQYVASQGRN